MRRLRAEQPAESDPLVLTLPQVPDGAVALVGETGSRYVRDPLSKDRWRLEVAGNVPGLPVIEVFRVERSVTVEMAPPREPRTWPKLTDQNDDDLPDVVQLLGSPNHAEFWRRYSPDDVLYSDGTSGMTLAELRMLGEVREVLT